MRAVLLIAALAALAACGSREKHATFTCPNGPSIAVTYAEDQATLSFSSGRIEVLPVTDVEDIYAKPGVTWDATAFRGARFDDDGKSYRCDQMAG